MHEHHHEDTDYSHAFIIGVALNVSFIIIEVVFGLAADFLALLADAGHNLSDVLGLLEELFHCENSCETWRCR